MFNRYDRSPRINKALRLIMPVLLFLCGAYSCSGENDRSTLCEQYDPNYRSIYTNKEVHEQFGQDVNVNSLVFVKGNGQLLVKVSSENGIGAIPFCVPVGTQVDNESTGN